MRMITTLAIVAALCLMTTAATAADEAKKDAPKTINLLEKKSLDGWDFFLVDPEVKKADVWSFNDAGNLCCKGKPMGYLCTKEKFKNFKLKVEWRWPEEPSNSGVLMRIHEEPAALPHCVEAQLQSGSAGDFWAFHDFVIDGPELTKKESPQHGVIRGLKKKVAAEKEPGEWNLYEIVVKGDKIEVSINGKEVNRATGVEESAGLLGFQSEGGPIEFRTIEVTPLD